jgi:hypothetical protein
MLWPRALGLTVDHDAATVSERLGIACVNAAPRCRALRIGAGSRKPTIRPNRTVGGPNAP